MNEQNSNIKTEMDGMYFIILFLNNQIKTFSTFVYFINFIDAGLVVEEPDISETSSSAQKDEFSEILGSHFNLDSMVRETGNFFFIFYFSMYFDNNRVHFYEFIYSL